MNAISINVIFSLKKICVAIVDRFHESRLKSSSMQND
jgi:hypothetical protein